MGIIESTAKSIYYKFRNTGEINNSVLGLKKKKHKAPTRKHNS